MSQSQIYFIYFFFLTHKQPNENPFKAYLYTECAYSGCEPQGGENMSAELDEKYENAWHSVA